MGELSKRKVKASEIIELIRRGTPRSTFLNDYGLSHARLQGLFDQLVHKKLITAEEISEKCPYICPACSEPIARRYDSCPRCQVVINRERNRIGASEPQQSVSAIVTDYGKCPYCKGDVPDGATKCMHCGEWLRETATETSNLRKRGKTLQRQPKKPEEQEGCLLLIKGSIYLIILLSLLWVVIIPDCSSYKTSTYDEPANTKDSYESDESDWYPDGAFYTTVRPTIGYASQKALEEDIKFGSIIIPQGEVVEQIDYVWLGISKIKYNGDYWWVHSEYIQK